MHQGRVYLCRKVGTGQPGAARRPEVVARIGAVPDEAWTAIDDPNPGTDLMLVALWAPEAAHDLLHAEGYCYVSARWGREGLRGVLPEPVGAAWHEAIERKGRLRAGGATVGAALRDVARQFLTRQRHGAEVPAHFLWFGAVL